MKNFFSAEAINLPKKGTKLQKMNNRQSKLIHKID
jgi:hypothetical protein